MGDKHVELFEGVRVEQHLDAFPRGELALAVLGVDPALAAAKPGRRAALFEFVQDVLHAAPLLSGFNGDSGRAADGKVPKPARCQSAMHAPRCANAGARDRYPPPCPATASGLAPRPCPAPQTGQPGRGRVATIRVSPHSPS
jgi:hypothetical protein